jgi:hypothetical protein
MAQPREDGSRWIGGKQLVDLQRSDLMAQDMLDDCPYHEIIRDEWNDHARQYALDDLGSVL